MTDWKKVLIEKYPGLLQGIEGRCGFYIDAGWLLLVEGLLYKLQWEIDGLPEEERSQYKVVQVKEKFGGLRFYMNKMTPTMSQNITLAEAKSHTICEKCGAPGRTASLGGWLKTYCDPCFAAKK